MWRHLGTLLAMIGLMPLAVMAGGPLSPIDPTKEAEINGKAVNMNDVNFGTLSQPTRPAPTASVGGKTRSYRDVTLGNATTSNVELETVELTDVPRQNFRAGRAAEDGRDRQEKVVGNVPAKIKDRQIRPFTPKGEDELKDQLNKRY